MTAIDADIEQYLLWLGVHNYAKTTTADRRRYLNYFTNFYRRRGVEDAAFVTFELLKEYQESLFAHRKVNGDPLTSGPRPSASSRPAVLFLAPPEWADQFESGL